MRPSGQQAQQDQEGHDAKAAICAGAVAVSPSSCVAARPRFQVSSPNCPGSSASANRIQESTAPTQRPIATVRLDRHGVCRHRSAMNQTADDPFENALAWRARKVEAALVGPSRRARPGRRGHAGRGALLGTPCAMASSNGGKRLRPLPGDGDRGRSSDADGPTAPCAQPPPVECVPLLFADP